MAIRLYLIPCLILIGYQYGLAQLPDNLPVPGSSMEDSIRVKINLSSQYLQNSRHEEARQMAQNALRDAQTQNLVHEQAQAHANIYKADSGLGRLDSALIHLRLSNRLNDSIQHLQNKTLRAKNDRLEQERQMLEQEKELARKRTQVTITLIVALVLLLLAIALWLFYRYRLLKNREVMAQQEALRQQEIEILKNENRLKQEEIAQLMQRQELKSVEAMINGQEQERKRIAQDLHDSLGSLLSTTKLQFDALLNKIDYLKTQDLEAYERSNHLLDEAVTEVRRISHNLLSGTLIKFGLQQAINEVVQRVEGSGNIHFEVRFVGLDNRLTSEQELVLFRIIQELINNTIRHAHANEISLSLTGLDNSGNLVYEDDGAGFDPNAASHKEGIGLQNIRTRVKQINGKIIVDSTPNKGISVVIDFPINLS